MQEQALHNENCSGFFYCFDDAADVISNNLSTELKSKYSREDILLVLELKDEYYDLCAQPSASNVCEFPIEIDESDLRRHIQYHAANNDLLLSEGDLIDILDAELIYFEQNGALRDAGEWLN